MFWAEIWKISEIFIWKFSVFLEVKFSIYLNRRVFVMSLHCSLRLDCPNTSQWHTCMTLMQRRTNADVTLGRCIDVGTTLSPRCVFLLRRLNIPGRNSVMYFLKRENICNLLFPLLVRRTPLEKSVMQNGKNLLLPFRVDPFSEEM